MNNKYLKNELLTELMQEYYNVFRMTLNTSRFVPTKSCNKIYNTIHSDMKRSLRDIEKEYKKATYRGFFGFVRSLFKPSKTTLKLEELSLSINDLASLIRSSVVKSSVADSSTDFETYASTSESVENEQSCFSDNSNDIEVDNTTGEVLKNE